MAASKATRKAWTCARTAPKFWAASLLVDQDAAQTQSSVEQVRAIAIAQPGLVVVPAHDSKVQDVLGYFPNWIKWGGVEAAVRR